MPAAARVGDHHVCPKAEPGPVVAASAEPMQVNPLAFLSGKKIHGWPSGSAIDSEDAMNFSVLTGVRPKVEVFPLAQANEAFGVMITNKARFRVVLTP